MTICTLACRATSDCPQTRTEACPARTGAAPVTIPGQAVLELDEVND